MLFHLHPENPEKRLISQIIKILQDGGVVILPTDSVYAFTCLPESKSAVEKIRKIKGMEKNDYFTVMCPSISSVQDLTTQIDNTAFKILKKNTPGSFTFIFEASKKLPKIIHSKRSTIGIRIPDDILIQMLLEEMNDYLISTSVINQDDEINRFYFDEEGLTKKFENQVDAIAFCETPPFYPSAIVDFTSEPFEVVREGKEPLIT